LFGLSGELAVKQMMLRLGMRPLPPEKKRDDPFYAHFPYLKTLLGGNGRLEGKLRQIADTSTLFQNWDTAMRYAPSDQISHKWVDAWMTSAKQLIEDMHYC
jgi:hypothetical protein